VLHTFGESLRLAILDHGMVNSIFTYQEMKQ